MKSPFRQKFSQKRSSSCALFKVMCFKLFQAFASKMIKEMLRFQTVKDINDAMQMKLFQTLCYPCVILLMKGVFIQTSCLLSGLVRLIIFSHVIDIAVRRFTWVKTLSGFYSYSAYPFQVSFIFRAFILTH